MAKKKKRKKKKGEEVARAQMDSRIPTLEAEARMRRGRQQRRLRVARELGGHLTATEGGDSESQL